MLVALLVQFCRVRKHEHTKFKIIKRHFHQEPEELFCLSTSQLHQRLKSENVNFTDGHTCTTIECPICSNVNSKTGKVFINKTTGFFICDQCQCNGSWPVIEKFLTLMKSEDSLKKRQFLKESLSVKKNMLHEWITLQAVHQNVSELSTDVYKHLFSKFSLPTVPKEEIAQLECLYDNKSTRLYFPLKAFQNHVVGYKCLSDGVEQTEPDSNVSGLITYKKAITKTEGNAVIVPTIPDLLALISQKAANTIICLPYALQCLPQQILPSLEKYKKLILWFGNDMVSWDTARHFAKKLNERRCYFVRPTELQPAPRHALHMGCDLKNIVQNAQPIWHKSITTFHSLRQDVLSDLQNIDKVQGVKWKRFPTLNRLLKGHRRGEFTILTGPTGCGKTTFICEYSLDLAMQGVNTLWGSFEIRNARLARTMLQQMAGISLDDNLDKFDTLANAFEKLPIYFMTFHGQQSIKVVMDAVEHATYVHDISHVIIDNVQFMMGITEEAKHVDRFWKQDKIIGDFRNFATKFNCHVTLVIHPRKERDNEDLTTSSIFGSAKASQEADNVLIIQDKRLTNLRGKKYLQVAKNRYSGDLGIMLLEFDKVSLSYGQKKKSDAKTESKGSEKKEKNIQKN